VGTMNALDESAMLLLRGEGGGGGGVPGGGREEKAHVHEVVAGVSARSQ
jgi:hypothetical protein